MIPNLILESSYDTLLFQKLTGVQQEESSYGRNNSYKLHGKEKWSESKGCRSGKRNGKYVTNWQLLKSAESSYYN